MVDVGANLQRSIQDIVLSRYACYLIAMNGDPHKEVIALAQTYFAVKTHEQEQLELQKEDLATPTKSIQQIKKERQKKLSK